MENENIIDMIYDVELPPGASPELSLISDPSTQVQVDPSWKGRDLLIPILREGKRVYSLPTLEEIREHSLKEQALFPDAMRRFLNPTPYPVGYELGLFERKRQMVQEITQRGKG